MTEWKSNKKIGEAAQQFFAFGLQQNRMLLTLMESNQGDVVWVEKYDDVGLTRADGTHFIEQDATYQSKNPLTNKSDKLWKTLANWVDAVKQDWVDPARTDFKFFVLQKHKLGPLAVLINDAKSDDEVAACFDEILKFHWGAAPKYVKRPKVSDTLKPHLDIFLAEEDTSKEIIRKVSIVHGDGDAWSAVMEALNNNAMLPKMGPYRKADLLLHLSGWVKRETDTILKTGGIAELSFEDFSNEVKRYIAEHLSNDMLSSMLREDDPEKIKSEVERSPTFIRQLKLIEFEQNDLIDAANNFFNARDDFNLWCADGEATKQQMEKFTEELKVYWRITSKGIPSAHSDVDYGRSLASDCLRQNLRFCNRDVPNYFTSGVFHDLANQSLDQLDIGWHRKYREMLKGE